MTNKKQTISNLKKLKSFHNGSYGADVNRAIQALSTLYKVIAYCKKSPSAILPEDVLSLIKGDEVEIETDYGYEKFEPCEDAISRQAVLEQINCWIGSGEYKYTNATYYLTGRMQELPPVNPQEKTGHWIENAPEYQNIDPPYICSECGNMHLRKTNYCDQCGCRMIKPQESEE